MVTIKSKLLFLTFGLLSSLFILGGISLWSSMILSKQLYDATQVQLPAVREMTLIDMMHDGIRANVFHAMLLSKESKDATEIQEVKEEAEEFAKKMRENFSLISNHPLTPEVLTEVEQARSTAESYIVLGHGVVDAVLSGKTEKAKTSLPLFLDKFKELEGSLEKLGEDIRNGAQKSSNEAISSSRWLKFLSIFSTGLSILLGALLAGWINRSLQNSLAQITKSLADESQNVQHTAVELNQSAQTLTGSTHQQASALQVDCTPKTGEIFNIV